MSKKWTLLLVALALLVACKERPLPKNVISESVGEACLLRDTTFTGARPAYIAQEGEFREAPRRLECLLRNGFRVVLPGKDSLSALAGSLREREDVRYVLLSARDSVWASGLDGVVLWEKEAAPYITARCGEHPLIRLDVNSNPETLIDLSERLAFEKIPLEIKGERSCWGSPSGKAEHYSSWGEVVRETFDYAVKDGDTLRLDVYRQPFCEGPRPIVLYSFGGGWQAGSRDMMDNPLFPFYTPMARLGYVVVAIDYRLGVAKAMEQGEIPSGNIAYMMVETKGTELESKIVNICRKACLNAVEDLFDATSFVVEHAADWGADASRIVLCGGSAGACNSLQAEYLVANEDPMALERLPEGFRFGGIVPCAGAIFTGGEPLAWKRQPSPILFFHGSADPIVPYGEGIDFMGPTAIIASLPENTPYVLYSILGEDHVISSLPSGYMNHAIASFIDSYVVGGDQSTLTVEERLTDTSERLIKRYLLSGYLHSRKEVADAYRKIYGPLPE